MAYFNKYRSRILISAWMILLFLLAQAPAAFCMSILQSPGNFMWAHVGAYFLFGFFMFLALRLRRECFGIRMTPRRSFWLAFGAAAVYSGLTEYSQVLAPDRQADWLDLYCNVIGIAGGIATFWVLRLWVKSRRSSVRTKLRLKSPLKPALPPRVAF